MSRTRKRLIREIGRAADWARSCRLQRMVMGAKRAAPHIVTFKTKKMFSRYETSFLTPGQMDAFAAKEIGRELSKAILCSNAILIVKSEDEMGNTIYDGTVRMVPML